MAATPLNYATQTKARSFKWLWRPVGVIASLVIAFAFSSGLTFREVEGRMDPVTGSITWKTVSLFGITSSTRVDVSALETRLKRSGIAWKPSWQFLHNRHSDIFGFTTGIECGSAPPSYQIHSILKAYADTSTDDELREFVHVKESGTPAEQEAAVTAAGNKGLESEAATLGGR